MPIVAIVGRPNVGKSLLFNKLAGKRLSIVEDTPGITRDRLYAPCNWTGHDFTIIDTGGIEPNTNDDMLLFMRAQAEIAIDSADVIVMVCDIRTGLTAADADVAAMLLRSKKPLVLAVNKVDSVGPPPADLYEFYNLGLGEPFPVSALHGHGTGDLLDACVSHFPENDNIQEDEDSIKIAIVGKPNAGKSSLLNKLIGEERAVVSEIPGTTRDAVSSVMKCDYGTYIFTDTAGIRRKSRVTGNIERYSVLRSVSAIEHSDVCLLLVDALEGVTEQDTKIAGMAHDAGKPSVIVMNKWDAVEKDDKTMLRLTSDVRRDLAFMPYAPVEFISALTGSRVSKLLPVIREVYEQSRRRITTGQLNEVLADAVARMQPPTDKGKRLKVFYMTQASTSPPHFIAFCNDSELFHYSYKRYLENRIREAFSLTGTPVKMTIRERGENNAAF